MSLIVNGAMGGVRPKLTDDITMQSEANLNDKEFEMTDKKGKKTPPPEEVEFSASVAEGEEAAVEEAVEAETTPTDPLEKFKARLEEVGVSEAAVTILLDQELTTTEALAGFTYEDFVAMGIKAGSAKILADNFATSAIEPTSAPESPTAPTASMDILPTIPDEMTFTEMLKVGGVLKVGPTEVIAAVRAALAARTRLFDLPDELASRMEDHAESLDEPVGEEFFHLRSLVVKRSYADIMSALGIEGRFMSESRKNAFLARLEEHLWVALRGFQAQLEAWQRSWMEGAANPAMMMAAIATATSGGALPPGMMAPPDASPLRDAAEGVVNKVNRVFAGTGIPVARALAYDAQRIREILENERLPAAIGAVNREQMLKMLSADVSADYVRLEHNIARYTLAVMKFSEVGSGQEELVYLGAILQLGLSIPWDKLGPVEEVKPVPAGGGFRRDFD